MDYPLSECFEEAFFENEESKRLELISKGLKKITDILPFKKQIPMLLRNKDIMKYLFINFPFFKPVIKLILEVLFNKFSSSQKFIESCLNAGQYIAELRSEQDEQKADQDSIENKEYAARASLKHIFSKLSLPKYILNKLEDIKMNYLFYFQTISSLIIEKYPTYESYFVSTCNFIIAFIKYSNSDTLLAEICKCYTTLRQNWQLFKLDHYLSQSIEDLLVEKGRSLYPQYRIPTQQIVTEYSDQSFDQKKLESNNIDNILIEGGDQIIGATSKVGSSKVLGASASTPTRNQQSQGNQKQHPQLKKELSKKSITSKKSDDNSQKQGENNQKQEENKDIMTMQYKPPSESSLLEKWLCSDPVPQIVVMRRVTEERMSSEYFKLQENLEILLSFMFNPSQHPCSDLMKNFWKKNYSRKQKIHCQSFDLAFTQIGSTQQHILLDQSELGNQSHIQDESTLDENLEIMQLRSFIACNMLIDARNFRIMMKINKLYIEIFFQYFSDCLQMECKYINVNHALRVMEYLFGKENELCFYLFFTYNFPFKLIQYISMEQVPSFFQNFLLNLGSFPILNKEMHNKAWFYLKETDFFNELANVMVIPTADQFPVNKSKITYKTAQLRNILGNQPEKQRVYMQLHLSRDYFICQLRTLPEDMMEKINVKTDIDKIYKVLFKDANSPQNIAQSNSQKLMMKIRMLHCLGTLANVLKEGYPMLAKRQRQQLEQQQLLQKQQQRKEMKKKSIMKPEEGSGSDSESQEDDEEEADAVENNPSKPTSPAKRKSQIMELRKSVEGQQITQNLKLLKKKKSILIKSSSNKDINKLRESTDLKSQAKTTEQSQMSPGKKKLVRQATISAAQIVNSTFPTLTRKLSTALLVYESLELQQMAKVMSSKPQIDEENSQSNNNEKLSEPKYSNNSIMERSDEEQEHQNPTKESFHQATGQNTKSSNQLLNTPQIIGQSSGSHRSIPGLRLSNLKVIYNIDEKVGFRLPLLIPYQSPRELVDSVNAKSLNLQSPPVSLGNSKVLESNRNNSLLMSTNAQSRTNSQTNIPNPRSNSVYNTVTTMIRKSIFNNINKNGTDLSTNPRSMSVANSGNFGRALESMRAVGQSNSKDIVKTNSLSNLLQQNNVLATSEKPVAKSTESNTDVSNKQNVQLLQAIRAMQPNQAATTSIAASLKNKLSSADIIKPENNVINNNSIVAFSVQNQGSNKAQANTVIGNPKTRQFNGLFIGCSKDSFVKNEKMDYLYPLSLTHMEETQIDIQAQNRQYNFDFLEKVDNFSYNCAQVICGILQEAFNFEQNKQIYKHFKNHYELSTKIIYQAFFQDKSKIIEALMKNYLFKIKYFSKSIENSSSVCGKTINLILKNIEITGLQPYRLDIFHHISIYLLYLTKLISACFSWNTSHIANFNDYVFKLQKMELPEHLWSIQVILVQTLSLSLHQLLKLKKISEFLQNVGLPCWHSIIMLLFVNRTNNIYQNLFIDIMDSIFQSGNQHVLFNIFFKLGLFNYISLSFEEMFNNYVFNKQLHMDALFINFGRFKKNLQKSLKENEGSMLELIQQLKTISCWQMLNDVYQDQSSQKILRKDSISSSLNNYTETKKLDYSTSAHRRSIDTLNFPPVQKSPMNISSPMSTKNQNGSRPSLQLSARPVISRISKRDMK